LLLAAFALSCFIAYTMMRKWQIRQASKQIAVDPLLSGYALQQPTVVFFTTPMCQACKYQQGPILDRLNHQHGVQVIQVDASENAEAASKWGVMTAPTTFVLNKIGEVLFVNNGVTDEYVLKQQLGLQS
ncbi:MAG: thioredoxin family protein, partial [Anaerolineae bacterium]|nr:thioredoxin family protein [Anaerolineae bacterium]